MVYDGILLNAAVSLIGGGAYLALVRRPLKDREDRASGALALFFTATGLHLVLAGARQFVAYAEITPEFANLSEFFDLEALDLTLFLVTTIVGALTVVPLAFYACEIKAPHRSVGISMALSAYAALGLAFFLAAPKTGPIVSRWGSDWSVASLPVSLLLGTAIMVPAAAAAFALLRAPTDPAQTLGLAALVYYGAIIPDALGLSGAAFVIARIAAASSALFAYEATRRPFQQILRSIAQEGHTGRARSPARAPAPVRANKR